MDRARVSTNDLISVNQNINFRTEALRITACADSKQPGSLAWPTLRLRNVGFNNNLVELQNRKSILFPVTAVLTPNTKYDLKY
jgi:hypothetical protein